MTQPLDVYLKGGYVVDVLEEEAPGDGGKIYVAYIRAMPGCLAQGASPDEAKGRLDDIKSEYIQHRHERGAPLPEPDFDVGVVASISRTTLTGDGFASLWEKIGVVKVSGPRETEVRKLAAMT